MEKHELRNKLFDKYFEVEDGILIIDFLSKLSFIQETWKDLHSLCEKNIDFFSWFSTLEKIKVIEYKNNKYLILKLGLYEYTIIDLEKMVNVKQEEFKEIFTEEFFVNNFDEDKDEDVINYICIEEYDGDIQELLDFYIEKEDVLLLSTKFFYELKENDAYTYLSFDFANRGIQMGFGTPDQFLYEHLLLNHDLTPYGLQDAQNKIGVERMKEMFEQIKGIKIPINVIPNDLYQQYLLKTDNKVKKL